MGDTLYKYYLDGSNIIAETRTTGNTIRKLKYYYGATGLVGFNHNGTDYYYQKNVQGDIIRIYSNSGTLYGEYSYDAWGKCTIVTDINGIATINPFRYRGYYIDNETGLCYLNSRYYDPIVGRFLSPDSLEYLDPEHIKGLNLFAYCGNNPVMRTDGNGTSFQDVLTLFERIFTGLSDFCKHLVQYGSFNAKKFAKMNGISQRAALRYHNSVTAKTSRMGGSFRKSRGNYCCFSTSNGYRIVMVWELQKW